MSGYSGLISVHGQNQLGKSNGSLNVNWEASRSSIFKAVLLSQNPGVGFCDFCHKAPFLLRCDECGGSRMCPDCDATIHEENLFHDREALIDGSFRHIPPTLKVNEDGKLEQSSKLILLICIIF